MGAPTYALAVVVFSFVGCLSCGLYVIIRIA